MRTKPARSVSRIPISGSYNRAFADFGLGGEIAAATTIMLEDLEVLHHGSKLQRRLRLEVWLCFLQQKGSPPGHSSLGDNNCLLDLGGIDTFHSILEHGGKYI